MAYQTNVGDIDIQPQWERDTGNSLLSNMCFGFLISHIIIFTAFAFHFLHLFIPQYCCSSILSSITHHICYSVNVLFISLKYHILFYPVCFTAFFMCKQLHLSCDLIFDEFSASLYPCGIIPHTFTKFLGS